MPVVPIVELIQRVRPLNLLPRQRVDRKNTSIYAGLVVRRILYAFDASGNGNNAQGMSGSRLKIGRLVQIPVDRIESILIFKRIERGAVAGTKQDERQACDKEKKLLGSRVHWNRKLNVG